MYVFIHRVSVFQQCTGYENEKLPTVRKIQKIKIANSAEGIKLKNCRECEKYRA